MIESITLNPANIVAGTVVLPGSKSISNRTLLLSALAEGTTFIHGLLDSDDTDRMLDALKMLGVIIEQLENRDFRVTGVAGKFPVREADLFLGNAGTAFRPLTAVLALSNGNFKLSGIQRMHERPIGDLVESLKEAGAQIEYCEKTGFPPLRIYPSKLKSNQPISIRGNVSSQFLTALLMALPLSDMEFKVEVLGELISKPYIEITLNLMEKFGVHIERDGWESFTIPSNSKYLSPGSIHVEGDASSASYFLAAGAIAGNTSGIRVEGISLTSIQGDIKFVDELIKMGAKVAFDDNSITVRSAGTKLKSLDLDCNHIPDAAMTLAILALFAEGTTTLRNIASWRVKETDRLSAMATELRKLGALVDEGTNSIKITPPLKLKSGVTIDTYDDHRIAMCFSLVCLGGVSVTINDPNCVRKTFPDYFDRFSKVVNQI